MSDDASTDLNELVEVPEIPNTAAYDHPSLRDNFRLSMWIPKEQVGKVIGKKGVVILHIQRETQAKVIMNPPTVADSHWSPVLVLGDPSKTLSAYRMVRELVDDVDDVIAEFPIPRQKHQRIVGSGGITIRTISAKTNVRIWVPSYKEVDAGSNISLEGECLDVFRALELILDVTFRGANKITKKKEDNSPFRVYDSDLSNKKYVAIPVTLVGLLLARRGTGETATPNVLKQLERLTGARIWKLNNDDDEVEKLKNMRVEVEVRENVDVEEHPENDDDIEAQDTGDVEDDVEDDGSEGFEDAHEHERLQLENEDVEDDVEHEDDEVEKGDIIAGDDIESHVEGEEADISGSKVISSEPLEMVYFSVTGDHHSSVYQAVTGLRRIVGGERIIKVLQRLQLQSSDRTEHRGDEARSYRTDRDSTSTSTYVRRDRDSRGSRNTVGTESNNTTTTITNTNTSKDKKLLSLGRRVDISAVFKVKRPPLSTASNGGGGGGRFSSRRGRGGRGSAGGRHGRNNNNNTTENED